MSKPKVPAVVLICYKGETENFKEVSPKEAGMGWWRRLFNKGPVPIKISTEIAKIGVRVFCELDAVPKTFDRILVPAVIDGKQQSLRLVVLHASARGKITAPIVVRCAFDFGYSAFEMEACSKMNVCGYVEEVTCKWLIANAKKITEIFRLEQSHMIQGVETWCIKKTIPYEWSCP